MGAKKQRTHEVTIKVRFDKPVFRHAAVNAVRNSVYGEIYASIHEAELDGWEIAKIGRAR